MSQPSISTTRWSTTVFLDRLRDRSDPLADQCARELPREQALAFLFTKMRTDAVLPGDLPEAFSRFLRSARPSLELDDLTASDHARLLRGQKLFMTHALPAALVLLIKSLQEGVSGATAREGPDDLRRAAERHLPASARRAPDAAAGLGTGKLRAEA